MRLKKLLSLASVVVFFALVSNGCAHPNVIHVIHNEEFSKVLPGTVLTTPEGPVTTIEPGYFLTDEVLQEIKETSIKE